MNPQATTSPQPGVALQPQPANVNPQGVASIAPIAPPTPTQLPTAQPQTPSINLGAIPQQNTSMAPALGAIADYYNIPRQTAQVVNQGQTQANIASSQFEAQKFQNTLKAQHIQDSLDASKYHFTKNADGTVNIFNSLGDKVDIGTYASLTGDNPATALQKAGATDQASQKFIAAYNNLQSYVAAKQAAQNGDITAQAQVKDFDKANLGLENLELGQLGQAFMQQYGSYLGAPSGDNANALQGIGVNSTIASFNNPKSTSAYYGNFPSPSVAAAPTTSVSDILGGLAATPAGK